MTFSFGDAHGLNLAPTAWQATADNTVERLYTEIPENPRPKTLDSAAEAVNAQVKFTEQKLDALRSMAREASVTADSLFKAVDGMIEALRAPGTELAKALETIAELEKVNARIVEQAGQHKRRNRELKGAVDRAQGMIDELQKAAPPMPDSIFFLRKRTPGDSVRYLAGEVMKRAADNIELAGIAMALNMAAVDVDSLPQGRA